MNSFTMYAFSGLLLATVVMTGMSVKGMVIAVARKKRGKIGKSTSVAFGIFGMLMGFLMSLFLFRVVVPSFGGAATVLSVLAICLVSAAVQVKIGFFLNPLVTQPAADTASEVAMSAVTGVEPSLTPSKDVATKPASVVPTVVPAAAATAVAVSSTAAPALLATSAENDELDAWADEQAELPASTPAAPAVAAAPVAASPATLVTAKVPEVAAPVAAESAPHLDLVDAAFLAEQYEEFDRTQHLFLDADDTINQATNESAAHEYRELQAA